MTQEEAMHRAGALLDAQIAVARATELAVLTKHAEPTQQELDNFRQERDAVWREFKANTLQMLRHRLAGKNK